MNTQFSVHYIWDMTLMLGANLINYYF